MHVDHKTVVRHLAIIGKVKKLDNWVPADLTDPHKMQRFDVSSALILHSRNDPFLERIVTCDEKWIMYDNIKRFGQWLDKDEPPRHFLMAKITQKKIMVTVWWSAAGVMHYKFLKPSETITAERYYQQK